MSYRPGVCRECHQESDACNERGYGECCGHLEPRFVCKDCKHTFVLTDDEWAARKRCESCFDDYAIATGGQ